MLMPNPCSGDFNSFVKWLLPTGGNHNDDEVFMRFEGLNYEGKYRGPHYGLLHVMKIPA